MVEKKIAILRGDPVKIKLCGKNIEIKKLTIDRQMDLMQLFNAMAEGLKDTDFKGQVNFFINILSFVTKVEEGKINEESNFLEIVNAFMIVYDREVSPLLQGVAKFGEMIKKK